MTVLDALAAFNTATHSRRDPVVVVDHAGFEPVADSEARGQTCFTLDGNTVVEHLRLRVQEVACEGRFTPPEAICDTSAGVLDVALDIACVRRLDDNGPASSSRSFQDAKRLLFGGHPLARVRHRLDPDLSEFHDCHWVIGVGTGAARV